MSKRDEMSMITWRGIGIVSGIEIGFLEKRVSQAAKPQENCIAQEELQRFEDAVKLLNESLQEKAESFGLPEEEAAIFLSHQMMLQDPEWQGEIRSGIEDHQWDAVYATEHVSFAMADLLDQLEDPYLRERSQDIRDLSDCLNRLMTDAKDPYSNLEGKIVLTEELRPSEVMEYYKAKVAGILALRGGKTSHAALLAKSRNLPYISGLPEELMGLEQGAKLAMDAEAGEVYFQLTKDMYHRLEDQKNQAHENQKRYDAMKFLDGQSQDGEKRKVSANIAGEEDIERVLESGAQGIALYRTEFLFLDQKDLPTEEEQFGVYCRVAKAMGEKSIIVRTMDIGGDKGNERFFSKKEENPFLGLRGIRFALSREDLFLTQLRALLRASVYGDIRLMFPMVTEIEDMIRGKAVLEKAKASLRKEGIVFREDILVGAMIEVPSAALCARALAMESDFFSIGTNDLMQYTLAADRMNETVQEWYDPYNPGLLSLITHCVQQGRKQGIHVGMCGDLAAEQNLVPFWNAIGIQEYGVTTPKVSALKYALSQSKGLGQELWIEDVINSFSSQAVLEKLRLKSTADR